MSSVSFNSLGFEKNGVARKRRERGFEHGGSVGGWFERESIFIWGVSSITVFVDGCLTLVARSCIFGSFGSRIFNSLPMAFVESTYSSSSFNRELLLLPKSLGFLRFSSFWLVFVQSCQKKLSLKLIVVTIGWNVCWSFALLHWSCWSVEKYNSNIGGRRI